MSLVPQLGPHNLRGMSTIQSHIVPPRNTSQCWSWTHVVLAILLAMNLQLFLMFNSKDEIAGPVNTLSKEPAWDHDKVLLRMAELQKTLWLYIPFLIMLAFSMGFMLGRQGCTWQKLQAEKLTMKLPIGVQILETTQ